MSDGKIFNKARWPLHIALAWRLSKCPDYLNKVQPDTFRPWLPWPDGTGPADAHSAAWREIHDLMSSTTLPISECEGGPVRIQAYGVPAGAKEEIPIPPEVVATLEWDSDDARDDVGLVTRRGLPLDPTKAFRQVTVPAGAVRYNFGGAAPLLSAKQYFGPAPEPGMKAFIRLGEAAYWIASNGNRRDFFAEDVEVWSGAYDALAAQIQIGKGRSDWARPERRQPGSCRLASCRPEGVPPATASVA